MTGGGIKHDHGKPDLSLIPLSALASEAHGFSAGASKYGRDNWRDGMPLCRVLAAALRHIYKFLDGEDFDKETGVLHLGLARAELAFAIEYFTKGTGEDDRHVATRKVA